MGFKRLLTAWNRKWLDELNRMLEELFNGGATLGDGSVTSDKIKNGSITNDKLADSTIDSSKLKDNSITELKLSDDSVTKSKIKDSSVNIEKIEDKIAYSLLPSSILAWNTFRIATTLNQKFYYGAQSVSLNADDDFFYKTANDFGLSFKFPVKSGQSLTFVGNSTYWVTCIKYDKNMICKGGTGFQPNKNVVNFTEDGFAYIVIKKSNGTFLSLSDISSLTAQVYSKDISVDSVINDTNSTFNYSELNFVQGSYAFKPGEKVGEFSYSNYRLSTIFEVRKGSEFVLNHKLSIGTNKYKFALYLVGENDVCLYGAGWSTKESVKVRINQDISKVMLMYSREPDAVMTIKDIEAIDIQLDFSDNANIGYKNMEEVYTSFVNDGNLFGSISTSWEQKNSSIIIGSNTPTGNSDKRLLTKLKLEKNTTYLFNLNAPYEYRVNFGHADSSNIGLYDSFWHWGEYRFKTGDTDEFLYVVVGKRDDSVIDISETIKFSPNIVKIQPFNTSLDTTTARKVIMHRGAMQLAPENTLASFKEAARLNLWATEMDVQYTKDNVAIIMHNSTVDEMTDGTGAVADMTLEQIKALKIDAGANISKYPNLKVPTLEEAINACKLYGIVPVLDCGTPLATQKGTQMLVADLKKLGVEQTCIVLTQGTTNSCNFRFYNQTTPIIVQYTGNFSTALGVSLEKGGQIEAARLYRWCEAYCGGWNFDRVGTTDDMLENLWTQGHKLQLKFYGITNDKEQAKNWYSRGMDFVSSDDTTIIEI